MRSRETRAFPGKSEREISFLGDRLDALARTLDTPFLTDNIHIHILETTGQVKIHGVNISRVNRNTYIDKKMQRANRKYVILILHII